MDRINHGINAIFDSILVSKTVVHKYFVTKTCINIKYMAGCIGHIIQNKISNVYTFITYDKIVQTTYTDIRRTNHTKRNMSRNLIISFRQTIKYFKCMFQEIFLIDPKTM